MEHDSVSVSANPEDIPEILKRARNGKEGLDLDLDRSLTIRK